MYSSYHTVSELESPDTLHNLALQCIVNNIDIITETLPGSSLRRTRNNVILPYMTCESFLEAYQRKNGMHEGLIGDIANAFADPEKTMLKTVKLQRSTIDDDSLKILLEQKPRVLELVSCEKITSATLKNINDNSENLISLKISDGTNVFYTYEIDRKCGYVINAPKLEKLILQRKWLESIPSLLLTPLTNLSHLDLSECTSRSEAGDCFQQLKQIEVLILYNTKWVHSVISWIKTLKTLRFLDISQFHEGLEFSNPNETLFELVSSLPKLSGLDISGTNLAGRASAWPECPQESNGLCDIPGLVGRVNRPLEFLGLYETKHSACMRHHIPAKKISGHCTREQVLIAASIYMDRYDIMAGIIHTLYDICCDGANTDSYRILNVVLYIMKKHPMSRTFQINGSAILYRIVEGIDLSVTTVRTKSSIISALLDGTNYYILDKKMSQNVVLTLFLFKMPADIMFEFEKIMLLLTSYLLYDHLNLFVQRYSMYLINAVVRRVDGHHKTVLGNIGIIKKMLDFISGKVRRKLSGVVLEEAWCTIWNVTNEMPQNSSTFIADGGIDRFLLCFEAFPFRGVLLCNMIDVLSNVAEVPTLRSHLMTPDLVEVFLGLLNYSRDGIEVSYKAAGLLSHLVSSGEESWTVGSPSRPTVLRRITITCQRWNFMSKCNVTYRSFKPILRLVNVYHTQPCQLWAVWTLAYLTSAYPERYCSLVEDEGGYNMLVDLMKHSEPCPRVKELAALVLQNCEAHLHPQVLVVQEV